MIFEAHDARSLGKTTTSIPSKAKKDNISFFNVISIHNSPIDSIQVYCHKLFRETSRPIFVVNSIQIQSECFRSWNMILAINFTFQSSSTSTLQECVNENRSNREFQYFDGKAMFGRRKQQGFKNVTLIVLHFNLSLKKMFALFFSYFISYCVCENGIFPKI